MNHVRRVPEELMYDVFKYSALQSLYLEYYNYQTLDKSMWLLTSQPEDWAYES